MQCLLCKQEREKLVKAHIFPRGFFNRLPTKRRVDTMTTDGQRGRKLQNAIYDPSILCNECEDRIMKPLDDYGIQTIRDRKNAFPAQLPAGAPLNLWIFDGVDKKQLCSFVASILWRVSVSQQLEIRDINIGASYEERIRAGLLAGDVLPFVDVVIFYLTHPMHGAFLVPYKKKLRVLDKRRDHEDVDGWILQFPNISLTVSMDDRLHPHRWFLSLLPDLTGRPSPLLASTSLHPEADQYSLLAFEGEKQDNILSHIARGLMNTHAQQDKSSVRDKPRR